SHHSNGQAGPHAGEPPAAAPHRRLAPAGDPPPRIDPAPTDPAAALEAVQANLAALQRLAAQTADLHRPFPEGQEKTQQTFLTLLEHQQRLSRPRPGATARSAPAQDPTQDADVGESGAIPTAGREPSPEPRPLAAGVPAPSLDAQPSAEVTHS